MGLSLTQVARYAQVPAETADGRMIEELLTDSRYLRRADVCLFVALKTAKNDGHRYIPQLYGKGVRAFLVSAMPEAAS
ncbi:MAG: hypothetical protein K2H62_02895, partial [Bacteroidales bacterium]|nr:hypothetical protein [Bacteroidales bacterium]